MSEIDVIEATTDKPSQIQPLTKDDACKISSGQVISSLAIAVKELIENSLDAGATLIEVKFKEQGISSLEVVDNGCGVKEEDFVGLTRRHATSKLQNFSQLSEVETFGFRGEALNSLCALGKVVIQTKHESATRATRLEFDHSGNIVKQGPCSGQTGTHVYLTELFSSLPVRKREFAKNIKKEYAKALEILTAYCLISSSTRFIVTNQAKNGCRSQVMSTNAKASVTENIKSIFGQKQMEQLVEIKTPNLGNEAEDARLAKYKVEGFVSDCQHGSGRSSKDRQFFYINSRPCEAKTLLKFINEIYKKFNIQQYPFIFLNIIMNKDDVDINVTPDKRQLFIADEHILKQAILKSLTETYEAIQNVYTIRTIKPFLNKSSSNEGSQDEKMNESESEPEEIAVPSQKKYSQALSQWKNTGSTDDSFDIESPETRFKRKLDDEIEIRTKKLKMVQGMLQKNAQPMNASYESEDDLEDLTLEEEPNNFATPKRAQIEHIKTISCKTVTPKLVQRSLLETIPKKLTIEKKSPLPVTKSSPKTSKLSSIPTPQNLHCAKNTIKITLDEIKSKMDAELDARDAYNQRNEDAQLKFKAKINPELNENAESELRREISKEMFLKMEIIGQFNLGFIIVRLEDDLFIVDQHASAEKYNFEDLIKNTEIQSQSLVCPEQLELSATNEIILIDNLPLFEKNGFKFKINNEKPSTKRVSLTAKPFSKNWSFGKADIEEMLHLLYEAPNSTDIRPSRVRAMFASRACRKSVMIGDFLTQGQMKRIVSQLSTLDQPWNCPHGRPTMRHLVNLNHLKIEN
ncbi:mismatch repair endonuclease PMS2 [Culicoides brevitarsis]|uniref:mismatch repair endonuclease PMS2 n=1 Tax=Culicoides brevitarsis TaxID=469753 RepID=UPI00307C4B61